MKHLTKKTKRWAAFCATFCFSSVVLAAGLMYLNNIALAELRSRIEANVRQEAEMIQLQSLRELLKSSSDDRTELEARIIREGDVTAFLSDIEALGRARGIGVTTNSLIVRPREGDDAFETLVASFDFSGSLAATIDMLSLLETIPYDVSVERVLLAREKDAAWKGAIVLAVTKAK